MNIAPFDKLAYLDALKAGGVSEEHARAHANALDSALRESVATKEDLRVANAALLVELHADLAGFKMDVVKWIVSVAMAQTALIVALIKLI